jgi:serine/threonine protein kinase
MVASPLKSSTGQIRLGKQGQYVLEKHLRSYSQIVECFVASEEGVEAPREIHILKTSRRADPGLTQEFLNLAQALHSLDHPALLPVETIDASGGRIFFVTPPRKSITLRKFLTQRDGRLRPKEVLKIGQELSSALMALNQQGIQHRGISLESVHVDMERHQVYFAEFPVDRREDLVPPTLEVPLTLLSGQLWDERSDVFLLSCLLYRLLAGELPLLEKVQRKTDSRIIPLFQAHPDLMLPDGIQSLLIVGLEQIPSRRLATTREFTRSLANCQGKPLIPVKDPSTEGEESLLGRSLRARRVAIQVHLEEEEDLRRRQRRNRTLGVVVLGLVMVFFLLRPSATGSTTASSSSTAPLAARPLPETLQAKVLPPQEVQKRQQHMEKVTLQVGFRNSTRESFNERWRVLQKWLETVHTRGGAPCTQTQLMQVRLGYLRGDPQALTRLDQWISEVGQLLQEEDEVEGESPLSPAKSPSKVRRPTSPPTTTHNGG